MIYESDTFLDVREKQRLLDFSIVHSYVTEKQISKISKVRRLFTRILPSLRIWKALERYRIIYSRIKRVKIFLLPKLLAN